MGRLLASLERRIGRYAIPHLITIIVGAMALVWVLSLTRPEMLPRMRLDMAAVRHGEVWRLVTFLILPLQDSPIWELFALYFTWWVGSSLEQHWGAFKFNAFYFVGALGTVVAAIVTGPQTNVWLDASLFLAFATIFPDAQVYLFFLLPIRVKWLGIVAAVGVGAAFVMGEWPVRGAIGAAFGNYVLFFAGHWLDAYKGRSLQVRQKARRAALQSDAPAHGQRTCAICGAREADGADIRVCSCDKCGGQQRQLCLAHARNH